MKKIILPVIFFLSLSITQPTKAQTVTVTTKTTIQPTITVKAPPSAFFVPVNNLLDRFKAAEVREDKIAQRIASRLEKIRASRMNVAKLDPLYLNITKQLAQLKKQVAQVETGATSFLSSTNPAKDYKLFRQQALDTETTLKTILNAEKNLVNQMKLYPTPTASASATVGAKQ